MQFTIVRAITGNYTLGWEQPLSSDIPTNRNKVKSTKELSDAVIINQLDTLQNRDAYRIEICTSYEAYSYELKSKMR